MSPIIEGSVRKCLVKKWSDGAGYGFNLHAEMGKSGHYIGKVDASSPAEKADLREGDRIVEVNNVNVGNENHKQVVSRIKAGGESVWLLVVDKDGDEYCKNNKISITKDLSSIKVVECPDEPSTVTAKDEDRESSKASTGRNSAVENDYETPSEVPPPPTVVDDPVEPKLAPPPCDDEDDLPPPPPELADLDEAVNSADDPLQPAVTTTETVKETEVSLQAESPPSPPPSPVVVEEPVKPVEPVAEPRAKTPEPVKPAEPAPQPTAPAAETVPKMTAAEMKAALAKKKRPDPRKEKALSAKDKLKMFQNL